MTLFLLFAFSKLHANIMFQSHSNINDSLHDADTILIGTKYFDEDKIYFIDSICKSSEQVLNKIPVPVFMFPKGGKVIYRPLKDEEGASEIVYDSINTLINIRHYKEKIGKDTLGDIIREIYYSTGSSDYIRVKYTNYKTGELLMLSLTDDIMANYNITYFHNNKVIKIDNYSMITASQQVSSSYSHFSSYYNENNLIGTKIIKPSNCNINGVFFYDDYCSIYFDECTDVSFWYKINKRKFSKNNIKKEEKDSWVKVIK